MSRGITHRLLLPDAGLTLADRSALPSVSIDQIVAEASVARGHLLRALR